MSIATQTATRMYMGGEEKTLSFQDFPSVGLSKVRIVLDQKVFRFNNANFHRRIA